MIGLATQETQENGAIVFCENPKTELRKMSPRATRVATLDGNSQVIHSGVSEGDRIFRVYADLTEDETDTIQSIYSAGQLIHLACREGLFLGYISELKLDKGDLRLTFYVKERLSQ
jgi:hypothetical protein